MKLIGRGWQYKVYDIGGEQVLKRYNSWFSAYMIMLRDSILYLRLPVINFSHYYYGGKKDAKNSLEKILKSNVDKRIFGNPQIKSEYEYTQDYAMPLSKCFIKMNDDEGEKLIDSFVDFCKLLFSNSMIEKNFNVADNFGLNKKGEVILIDLGEICFDKDEVLKQLRNRVWAATDVIARLPANLRGYFVEKMDSTFKV